MQVIGPFTFIYNRFIKEKRIHAKKQELILHLINDRQEHRLDVIGDLLDIPLTEVKGLVNELLLNRRLRGSIEGNSYVLLTSKGDEGVTMRVGMDLEKRKKKFEQILRMYEEIEMEDMANLLRFPDKFSLQDFLLELDSTAIAVVGSKVVINKEDVVGQIDELVATFMEFEQGKVGKA